MTGRARLRVGATVHDVGLERNGKGWRVVVDGEAFDLSSSKALVDLQRGVARLGDEEVPFSVESWTPSGAAADGAAGGRARVRSPMSGKLVEVRVREGATVGKGDVLFVLEAMKMQNEVRSPAAGIVRGIHAKAGDTLDTEKVVLEIEAPAVPRGAG